MSLRPRPVIDRGDEYIPAPPFASAADYGSFHAALAIHAAELGRASGGPHVETFALCAVIDQLTEYPAVVPENSYPSPAVLQIALQTYFPAAWTPDSLVSACAGRLPSHGGRWALISPDRLVEDQDPIFEAIRASDGSWSAQFIERGVKKPPEHLTDDWQMVIYLMQYLAESHPYPFGHGYADGYPERRRPAARAVVKAFAKVRELPFLQKWADDTDL